MYQDRDPHEEVKPDQHEKGFMISEIMKMSGAVFISIILPPTIPIWFAIYLWRWWGHSSKS